MLHLTAHKAPPSRGLVTVAQPRRGVVTPLRGGTGRLGGGPGSAVGKRWWGEQSPHLENSPEGRQVWEAGPADLGCPAVGPTAPGCQTPPGLLSPWGLGSRGLVSPRLKLSLCDPSVSCRQHLCECLAPKTSSVPPGPGSQQPMPLGEAPQHPGAQLSRCAE